MEATSLDRIVEALRNDPPRVHERAPSGVWAMAEDCLRFIGDHVNAGAKTLETGCGASTAVFAAAGAVHTAIYLEEREGAPLLDWLAGRGVDSGDLTMIAASSTETLPKLIGGEGWGGFDLIVIDGCHAFPFPMVDWYYASKGLRPGGIAVVDDVQLPAPRLLADFLDSDPRWERLARTPRWSAFRKLVGFDHDEEWTSQLFYRPAGQRQVELADKYRGTRLARLASRVRRRLTS